MNFRADVDGFFRLRTSNMVPTLSLKQLLDPATGNSNSPLYWDDQQVSGSGTNSTYQANKACVRLSVSANTAGRRVRQSRQWPVYLSGYSNIYKITFTPDPAGTPATASGITKRWGQYSDACGIFLEETVSGLGLCIRSSTSGSPSDARKVPQSEWNLNRLDTTSIYRLDTTSSFLMIVWYGWLGSGTVVIGFMFDDRIVLAHHFDNANELPDVFMENPNLPCRVEIINDGTGPACAFDFKCFSIASEGGDVLSGLPGGKGRSSGSPLVANPANTLYPICAMRLKAGCALATVKLSSFSLKTATASLLNARVIVNPVVSGPALFTTATDIPNSAVQMDLACSNATTLTLGANSWELYNDWITSASSTSIPLRGDYSIGTKIDGTSDIVVLAAQSPSIENIYGSMNFLEQQ